MGLDVTGPTDYSAVIIGERIIVTEPTKLSDKAYLTSREAAAYTGFSEVYFRKGRANTTTGNAIPHPPYIRVGRAIRYQRTKLDIWMNQFRVEPEKMGEDK